MTKQPQHEPDEQNGEVVDIINNIAERSRSILQDFANRHTASNSNVSSGGATSPFASAFLEFIEVTARDPHHMAMAQFDLWQDHVRLWHSATQRMFGQTSLPVINPEHGDHRFKDPAWEDNTLFDFIKQSYLLSSKFLLDAVASHEKMERKTQQKLEFYTKQFVDALAPSNFVATNPEVLRETLETRGENLLRGLSNMLEDLERGEGKLAIRMTDQDAFEIGSNIATTKGSVVFQTELMQLIQYEPTTEAVRKRPLLIVPPWINKFYILDLQAKNSFIKFAVDQGFTVYVVSWVNPDEELSHKSFEDYMTEGVLSALDGIRKSCGEKDVVAIGYCLGGTLLAATLAYMAVKRDTRIRAATFFTTMIDFEDPGELGVFIDEEQLAAMDEMMAKQGYLDGREMAATFNMLRANDLIWSFVVNNYLMGKEPFPFDLLYWNSDSTRMPATMHSFYLRKFYHENKLIERGGIDLCDVPVDLNKIKIPAYFVSTKEDHIAPWKATYSGTQQLSGKIRFTLAGSGHIAGIVNPPAKGKYGYWINDRLPADPDDWLASAEQRDGSWWQDWSGWMQCHAGALVDARQIQNPIEPAPGSFAMVRAD